MNKPSQKLVKHLRAFQKARKNYRLQKGSDLQALRQEELLFIFVGFSSIYGLLTDADDHIAWTALQAALTIFSSVLFYKRHKMINFLIAQEEVDIEKALGKTAATTLADDAAQES